MTAHDPLWPDARVECFERGTRRATDPQRCWSQNRTDLAERGIACPGHFYLSNGARTEVYRPTVVIGRKRGEKISREHEAACQSALDWDPSSAPMPKHTQHKRFAAVLRGHYGYYGRPHSYPVLIGFYREARRTWLRCLRRRSQKSRRIGWSEFETLTARFRQPVPRITRTWAQARI